MKSFKFEIDGIIFEGRLQDNGDVGFTIDNGEVIYLSKETATLLGASLLQISSEDDDE